MPQDSHTKHSVLPRVPSAPTGDVETVVMRKQSNQKIKRKNRRVQNRKKEKVVNRKLKMIGINSAGLSSKFDSFDKVLEDIQPGCSLSKKAK